MNTVTDVGVDPPLLLPNVAMTAVTDDQSTVAPMPVLAPYVFDALIPVSCRPRQWPAAAEPGATPRTRRWAAFYHYVSRWNFDSMIRFVIFCVSQSAWDCIRM